MKKNFVALLLVVMIAVSMTSIPTFAAGQPTQSIKGFELYPAYKSIALEWDAVQGATQYWIYRDGKCIAKGKDTKAYDSNKRAYIDKGLYEGYKQSKHTYYIEAYSGKTKIATSNKKSEAPVHQLFINITFKQSVTLTAHDEKKPSKRINKKHRFKAGQTVYAHGYLLGQYKFRYKIGGKEYLFYVNDYRVKKFKANYTKKFNYSNKTAEYFANTSGASSKKNTLIWTNLYTQHIYILKGSKGKWRMYNAKYKGNLWNNWEISSGKASTPSPTGFYSIKRKIGSRHGIKKWNTFHSWSSIHGAVDRKGYGVPYSGGCIRNPNTKIDFIYAKMPKGTRVINY